MRILIVLTYYRPHYSGLTIHAEREARTLVELGHQVTVLTSRFEDSLPAREMKDGVEIIRPHVLMRISKGVIMPSLPLWAFRLARNADVIHLHAPQLDAAPIAILCRILRKPVVLTYHCDLQLPSGKMHRLANLASNLANRISARLAHIIVHNTRDYAENSPLLKKYLSKVHPIFPPVEVSPVTVQDLQLFRKKYGLLSDQRIIGMAARLATEKGVEYLAEALPLVVEKFPTARVLFVGPYQNVVGEAAYAAKLTPLLDRLDANWSFLGILTPVEISAFFHECEVTVLPSINSTESYGLVQVESMSCGTPVIASDLPGVRVPVLESGMGCVTPVGDAPALAKAIIEVLSEPDKFRKENNPVVAKSTPQAVAIEYLAVFQQAQEMALNEHSRREK
jgi:glycosyltransferase involved in cell wall biosynthesis